MNNTTDNLTVESYISTLLNCMDSKVFVDESSDIDSSEDDFEEIIDEYHAEHDAKHITTCRYLSFAIGEVSYIILFSDVINIKRVYDGDINCGTGRYDAARILGGHGFDQKKYKYSIFINDGLDYMIGVDTISGLLEFSDAEMRLRKSVSIRPWLKGVSRDYQHLLLDSHALGKSLSASIKRTGFGTNPALI